MRFDEILDRLGDLPLFDAATVARFDPGDRAALKARLHRWVKRGRLVSLRRGMYAFAERYRREPLSPLLVANNLYRPSYLSGLWVLGFLELLPEMVTTFTSVSTRVPRVFESSLGRFEYRHVKGELFFGFGLREIAGQQVWMAEPEKALLDLWHLEHGEWDLDRLRSMRFQRQEIVDAGRLAEYAERFAMPRLVRAVAAWQRYRQEEERDA